MDCNLCHMNFAPYNDPAAFFTAARGENPYGYLMCQERYKDNRSQPARLNITHRKKKKVNKSYFICTAAKILRVRAQLLPPATDINAHSRVHTVVCICVSMLSQEELNHGYYICIYLDCLHTYFPI